MSHDTRNAAKRCQPCDLALQFTVQKTANDVSDWVPISVEPLDAEKAFKSGPDTPCECWLCHRLSSFKVQYWQPACCLLICGAVSSCFKRPSNWLMIQHQRTSCSILSSVISRLPPGGDGCCSPASSRLLVVPLNVLLRCPAIFAATNYRYFWREVRRLHGNKTGHLNPQKICFPNPNKVVYVHTLSSRYKM